jgi:AMMECR1 domain-containing protein
VNEQTQTAVTKQFDRRRIVFTRMSLGGGIDELRGCGGGNKNEERG